MPGSIRRNAIIAVMIGSLVGAVTGTWTAKATWRASIDELQRDTLLAADKLELLIRNIRLGVEAVAARLDPADLSGSAEQAWPAIEGENLGLRTILVLMAQAPRSRPLVKSRHWSG